MHKFKTLTLLLIALCLTLPFAACTGESEEDEDKETRLPAGDEVPDSLIGDWIVDDVISVTFKADGTGDLSYYDGTPGYVFQYTYHAAAGTISVLELSFMTQETWTIENFTAKRLTLKIPSADNNQYNFEKTIFLLGDLVPDEMLGTWFMSDSSRIVFTEDGKGNFYYAGESGAETGTDGSEVFRSSFKFNFAYHMTSTALEVVIDAELYEWNVETRTDEELVFTDQDGVSHICFREWDADAYPVAPDPTLLAGAWGTEGNLDFELLEDGTLVSYEADIDSILTYGTWSYLAEKQFLDMGSYGQIFVTALTEDYMIYNDLYEPDYTHIYFRFIGDENWSVGDVSLLTGKTWHTYEKGFEVTYTFNADGTGVHTNAYYGENASWPLTYTFDAEEEKIIVSMDDKRGHPEEVEMYVHNLSDTRLFIASTYSLTNDKWEYINQEFYGK